jgi:chromosome segregation ATPase
MLPEDIAKMNRDELDRLLRELAEARAAYLAVADSYNQRCRERDGLRRELSTSQQTEAAMRRRLEEYVGYLAEALELLDQVETIAVNDKSGCPSCASVVNLIVATTFSPPTAAHDPGSPRSA